LQIKVYQRYHCGQLPSQQQLRVLHKWSVLFGTVDEAAARLYGGSPGLPDTSSAYYGEHAELAGEARTLCRLFPKVNRICFDPSSPQPLPHGFPFLAWTDVEETQALAAQTKGLMRTNPICHAWSFAPVVEKAAQEGQCLVLVRSA
jgi:hypothetical protein